MLEAHHATLPVLQVLLPLVELAVERGAHPDKLLSGSKLFYPDLGTKVHAVSLNQLDCVIKNALKHHNAELSFITGQLYVHTLAGYHSQLLCHCKNLQQLLRVLSILQPQYFPYCYAHRLTTAEHWHLFFNFAIQDPAQALKPFYYELLASVIAGFCRWRLPTLHAEIRFPYPAPAHIEQYHSHIHFDVSFNHHDFSVVFKRSDLSLAQPGALSSLVTRLKRSAALEPRPLGFIQSLEWRLLRQPKLGLAQLALQLNISQATLKRKLQQHNTSLVEIKDRLLRQQAMLRLVEQQQRNEDVASALLFSDLSNFRRAFKRWTGATPSTIKGN
ncbi:helix-turn-helix domain-containing protein [Pseudoalteromonas fenneropenaei]|uniref:Helix-turn-helix domain-containing protein n=1 Tax=Pseudoalteromonas fenneropenaei TaxID=1737459 RepID=A0ABV7CJ48_9GAMM